MNLESDSELFRAFGTEGDAPALDAGDGGLGNATSLGELGLGHLLELANDAHGITGGERYRRASRLVLGEGWRRRAQALPAGALAVRPVRPPRAIGHRWSASLGGGIGRAIRSRSVRCRGIRGQVDCLSRHASVAHWGRRLSSRHTFCIG